MCVTYATQSVVGPFQLSNVGKVFLLSIALSFVAVRPLRAEEQPLKKAYEDSIRWKNSWGLTFAGITAAQLVPLTFINNESDRRGYYFGATASSVGLIGFLLQPLPVLNDYPKINETTSLEEQARFYQRAKNSQKQSRSVFMHTANALYNLGAGLPLGIIFDDWVTAGILMSSGIVIGELVIYTHPSNLLESKNTSLSMGIVPNGTFITGTF